MLKLTVRGIPVEVETVDEAAELIKKLDSNPVAQQNNVRRIDIVVDKRIANSVSKPIVEQKLLPFSNGELRHKDSNLRKIQELLLKVGRPMHINDLIRGIGRRCAPRLKKSINGTLNSYVRSGKVFSRPGRGIYGLLQTSSTTSKIKKNYNKPRYPSNCLRCGIPFMGWTKDQKYCGRKCSGKILGVAGAIRLDKWRNEQKLLNAELQESVTTNPNVPRTKCITKRDGVEKRRIFE